MGKTYIIEQFGAAEYESCISINFLQNPEHKAIFEGSLEPSEIYKRMSLYLANVRFVPGSTLIFLDEIQACKKARTALKFLALEGSYDIVASGSLPGIHYRGADDAPPDEVSVPVGYECEVRMHALDFEEYLWACGVGEDAIQVLRNLALTADCLPDQLLARYQGLLREYLVVGGMPEVVSTFLESKNFDEAFEVQGKILNAYEDDVDKYASNANKPKIMRLYRSIPRQLAKDNTKFQYSKVERGGSARKFGTSIDWLIDAGLVCDVHNVSAPLLPLAAYEEPGEFKLYVTDTGLLTHLFGRETSDCFHSKPPETFSRFSSESSMPSASASAMSSSTLSAARAFLMSPSSFELHVDVGELSAAHHHVAHVKVTVEQGVRGRDGLHEPHEASAELARQEPRHAAGPEDKPRVPVVAGAQAQPVELPLKRADLGCSLLKPIGAKQDMRA